MSRRILRSVTRPVGLTASVADLYAAFAPYRYRATMPACAHCVSDEDLAALGERPLDQLPAALLGRYVLKAISTWGEVRDFKWLLPRLADLLAAGFLPVPAETFTAKLARGEWLAWPGAERRPVAQFLAAWWDHGLRSPPTPLSSAPQRLAAIAQADPGLTPYLARWEAELAAGDARLLTAQHVVELLCNTRLDPDDAGSLERLFWEPAGPAAAQLRAWLASPGLAEGLDHAIYDFADTPQARRLTVAAARLRRWREHTG